MKQALNALHEAFVNRVGPDRPGGKDEAKSEFHNFVFGDIVPELLADDSYDDEPAWEMGWQHKISDEWLSILPQPVNLNSSRDVSNLAALIDWGGYTVYGH